ncbi:hypothetical protein TIFTF001_021525 [Ficus carica]|uniref:Uncharacterized protein n=1 Tax=Ficus carica TaxID=3494 RepID=A0AA88AV00_FICCA|nr:hypothetical protein TIFTF001_021525 [Ficus carica]
MDLLQLRKLRLVYKKSSKKPLRKETIKNVIECIKVTMNPTSHGYPVFQADVTSNSDTKESAIVPCAKEVTYGDVLEHVNMVISFSDDHGFPCLVGLDTTDQAAFDKHTDEALDVIMDHVGSQVEGSALRNLKQEFLIIPIDDLNETFIADLAMALDMGLYKIGNPGDNCERRGVYDRVGTFSFLFPFLTCSACMPDLSDHERVKSDMDYCMQMTRDEEKAKAKAKAKALHKQLQKWDAMTLWESIDDDKKIDEHMKQEN